MEILLSSSLKKVSLRINSSALPLAMFSLYVPSSVKKLLFIILVLLSNYLSANENSDYLDQLIKKARIEKTWTKREWHVLLHYSPSLIQNNFTSLVDNENFFLSKQGKTSPQAELEATLKHLFKTSPDDETAIACRFPARLSLLKKTLKIPDQHIPQYQCTHLNNWLQNLAADGLTLIFPVSVLNSPASMFGHTFLRLDREKEKNQTY